MSDIYPVHEIGLQALHEKASVHATLMAELGPADAVLAAIDEPQASIGVEIQPGRAQSLIAGPVFGATHAAETGTPVEAGPLTVRTDEAGLYLFQA